MCRGPPASCKIKVNRMMQTPSAAAPHASRATRDPESRVGEFDANKSPVIQVQALSKTYQTVRGALHLFQDLNLEVEAGEMVAIVGQSGAGKSTLLHILGALDTPSTGTVYCASTNVAKLSAKEAAAFQKSRDWIRLAVPLSAAGVHGAGECGDAAFGAKYEEAGSA